MGQRLPDAALDASRRRQTRFRLISDTRFKFDCEIDSALSYPIIAGVCTCIGLVPLLPARCADLRMSTRLLQIENANFMSKLFLKTALYLTVVATGVLSMGERVWAVDTSDAFGCWLAEQRDGAATYKLAACGAKICGKAIRAASGGHHPTEAELASTANQSLFTGEKTGTASWSGPMYIFRFESKFDVELKVISKTELEIGNYWAKRSWSRVTCPHT
jgi:hypothetical protein